MKKYVGSIFCMLCMFVQANAQIWELNSTEITTGIAYTSDILGNVAGGFEQGVRYMDNFDLEVEIKKNKATVFIRTLENNAGSISELSGDIQAVSNIDADQSWRLYEAWGSLIVSEKTSVLLGIYDLNSEFDVINTAGLFINSSHGIGPDFASSGEFGPSIFPLTFTTARVKSLIRPGIEVKAAILNAFPDHPLNSEFVNPAKPSPQKRVLSVAEVTVFDKNAEGSSLERGTVETSTYRMVLGAWKYYGQRLGWNGSKQIEYGVYVSAESRVFSERNSSEEGLNAFVRFGMTNPRINQFSHYLGGGLSYTGLLSGRTEDVLGLAISLPVNGNKYQQFTRYEFGNEAITEVTYFAEVLPFLSVQFDLQYIANPNQAPNLDNAIVTGVRSVVHF